MKQSLLLLFSCAGCGLAAVPELPAAVDGGSSALVAQGEAAVARRGCHACHDPGDGTLSGQTMAQPGSRAYGANLTPDPDTGLGDWSDDAIARAIRTGLDDQLAPLCPPMPRFAAMDDGEVRAIVAYLRSLAPVRNDQIPESSCPPLKGDAAMADLAALADAGAPRDAGAPADAAAARDAIAPTDAAPGDAAAMADGAAGDGGVCVPRINEVQTAGAFGAADEFVEIVNPCGAEVDLGGWRLVYRSAAGATDVTLTSLGGALAPGAYLLCGGKDYPWLADLRFASGLAAAGGGVALRDGAGLVRDSLGWGSATNGLVRGKVAPAPPGDQSIARHPDGRDSGDNALDFTVGAPTPGFAN